MSATPCPTGPHAAQAQETHDEHVLPLADHATAPATARHAARPLLTSWGLDEDAVYDALLVISELVTNAVEHALPPAVLHLRPTTTADGHPTVHIDVTDGGPAPHPGPWAASCDHDEHGRGHTVVTALATHTGTHTTPTTTDHWATINTH
ncbi:ATP-binding protein [Streptomyces mirabilis]|uniref:ATP-binding protein n=1 Tax=Streptomyces mirabilis TaxID=68239 RepID=UPI00367AA3F6